MQLDSINKKLLNLLQRQFPLTEQPYADLALVLGIEAGEVISRIGRLKADGIIRQISPVFDARRLGYQTTLVAMKVSKSNLDQAEQVISRHPGVSHGYERDHAFNLWFTLAVPGDAIIEKELEQMTGSIESEAVFSLPASRLFKIGAYFNMEGEGHPAAGVSEQARIVPHKQAGLSPVDKLVINELQQDLPLEPTPFAGLATKLGMSADELLAQCHSLLQRGIMRRFGAAVNHNRAGFTANAMACWAVPSDAVESVGKKLASLPEVSHCYERKTNPLWPYNLFAMIHGRGKEACQEIASRVSQQTGFDDHVLLFSTREFKKTRVKYLV